MSYQRKENDLIILLIQTELTTQKVSLLNLIVIQQVMKECYSLKGS